MGGIQSAIDAKKRERSAERLREAGVDPAEYVRNDWPIPDFPDGGVATNFFISPAMKKGYIIKHIDQKFSVAGRPRMSFRERMDVPAYSPDSVRTLSSAEAWESAKKMIKAVIKGDTKTLEAMADEAFRRGGRVGLRSGMSGRRF